MITEQMLVAQFQRAMLNCEGPATPMVTTPELCARLVAEEAAELCAALLSRDIVAVAKEGADLVYVALGAMVRCGIDLEPVFAAVHWANMTKARAPLDAHGKLLKGPNYVPPDIEAELRKQGWRP